MYFKCTNIYLCSKRCRPLITVLHTCSCHQSDGLEVSVSNLCTVGLQDSYKLGAQDENSTMHLTSWLDCLKRELTTTGMYTPFHVVIDKEKRQNQQHLPLLSRIGCEEINILENWSMIMKMDITAWEDVLITAKCPYDLANLEQSGIFILKSLTPKLSQDVTSVIGMHPNGPRALQEVINIKQMDFCIPVAHNTVIPNQKRAIGKFRVSVRIYRGFVLEAQ